MRLFTLKCFHHPSQKIITAEYEQEVENRCNSIGRYGTVAESYSSRVAASSSSSLLLAIAGLE